MKTPFNLYRWIAAGALCAVTTMGAQAAPLHVRLTVDNHYGVYTGAADGSGLTFVGADHDWTDAETYTLAPAAGDYLYVVGWNQGLGSVQGFQGSVTTLHGMVYTNATDWEAVRRPSPFNGFTNGSTQPALSLLETDISTAAWQTSIITSGPGDAPWTDVHGGGLANWIWLDSFSPLQDGPMVGGYVIFRTALFNTPAPAPVPEPASAALALLALGALRRVRRTRAGCAPSTGALTS